VHSSSIPFPSAHACSRLGPGTLTAHKYRCLWLLASAPDQVHTALLHETRPSTPLTGMRPGVRKTSKKRLTLH